MAETNNVTLELSTGRFVHVAHEASDLETRLDKYDSHGEDGMLWLQRMDGHGVSIRASAVVGIYPLDSRSEPPDFDEIQVMIPRPAEIAIRIAEVLRRYGFGGPR